MNLPHEIRVELTQNPDDEDEWQMHVFGNDDRLMAVAQFTIPDWLYFTAAVEEVEKTLLHRGLIKKIMGESPK